MCLYASHFFEIFHHRNLIHLFEDKVIVAHDENGRGYYPSAMDPYVRKTKHIIPVDLPNKKLLGPF